MTYTTSRKLHRAVAGLGTVPIRAVAVLALVFLNAGVAHATHFRYGHLTWAPVSSPARTVEFTVQGVWRRDAYGNSGTGATNRCVTKTNPPANTTCTGAGGFAGVGDVIHETQGNTTLDFGDSTTTFGATIGGNKGLLYLVTSVDPTNNWLFGLALDHGSLPTIDTTIQHTYSGSATTFAAKVEDCCRISPCTSPNAHLNNPDNGYRVSTTVDLTPSYSNSSPVSSVPPIILCPQNGVCSFPVPVSDNEGDPVTYRLATKTEMRADYFENQGAQSGLGEPGEGMSCADATIDPMTGFYSWNTTGCRLAGDPLPVPPGGGCNNANLSSLYSTQVIIEETAPRKAKSAVDFLIQLVPACNLNTHTPTFQAPTPLCGSTRSVNPGHLLNFTVKAADVDAGDSATLNAVGLPAGATMAPVLPTAGNPVSSALSWTPGMADLGQHLITFTAVDSCNHQAICAITIDVSQENCTDGIDNDGDGLADCADPDCNGTPCNDGNACTTNDSCSGGTCTGGPPPNCDDNNVCTTDSCNPASGCAHTNNTAPCNDGVFCNGADTCAGGSCATHQGDPCPGGAECNNVCNEAAGNCAVGAGTPCTDDGNGCTNDTCDGSGACVHPNNTASCNDGVFCNGADTCSGGGCSVHAGDPCTGGAECNNVCNEGAGNCAVAASTPCTDDGNGCTNDTCNGTGACTHPNNTAPCDDGNACTTNDACSGGACAGGPPLGCNDNNACTDDSCEPGSGCTHVNNNAPCDDHNACTTVDACSGGSCHGGPTLSCDDNRVCTDDSCDPGSGCVHTNNTAPCDDGNACTTADTCSGGNCVGGPAAACDDGNACTSDTCIAPTGCSHAAVPSCCNVDSDCADTDHCTTNERCVGHACASDPVVCTDNNVCTDDSCNPATGCTYVNNNASCSDGDACTTNDSCSGGTCHGGPSLSCNDNDVCTDDSCNSTSGCVHTNNTAPCDDGTVCTSADHCVAGTCTGTALDCSDHSPCTVDTCNSLSGCAHAAGPAAPCLPPAKSIFAVRNGASTAKNKILWKWLKGPADVSSFGDPATGTTEYTLCVYDESNGGASSRLAMQSTIAPGGRWQKLGGGSSVTFRLKDRDATGQLKVLLKAPASGKGRITFKSKGDRTIPPVPVGTTLFSDDDALLVQLVNSAGKCWQSRFDSPAIRHRIASFKDKCGAGGQPPCN